MDRSILLKVILLISLIGVGVAAYQTYEHYTITESICDLSESFSCSVVTESRYGEFPQGSGLALSGWGMLWWLSIIGIVIAMLRRREFLEHMEFYLFVDFGLGVLTALYLIAVEVYFLPQETGEIVICPLCTVQHALIAVLIVMSYFLLKQPIRAYVDDIFMDGGQIDKGALFILGVLAVMAVGGFFILGGGQDREYPEFAACLAENDVTMYGFKLCPNCNKQVNLIGNTAFKEELEDTGRYVLCRPEEEARQPIGDRLQNITILPQYTDEVTPETTQGDLCAMNVGQGTPTWLIEHEGEVKQVSGWKTIPELAELSGCPVPEEFSGQTATHGDRVTEQ